MGDHSSVGVNCWVGTSLFRCFALRFFAQNRSYLRPTVSNLLSLKRATVIESFLSLCKKSKMSDSLVTFSNESLVFESGLLKKILFFANMSQTISRRKGGSYNYLTRQVLRNKTFKKCMSKFNFNSVIDCSFSIPNELYS